MGSEDCERGGERAVLLVRPLCSSDEPEFAEPLGIERLAGYLRAHGIERVQVLDRRLSAAERRAGLLAEDSPGFFDEVKRLYADGRWPDVVGISLMTADDVPDGRRVLSRLHAMFPKAVLQAGGVYVTTSPHEARRMLPRGTVLQQGEGEAALLELAGGQRGPSYVSPDEWAPAYRPQIARYARLGCAVNMQASRGCVGRCTFCATPGLPGGLGRWQPRDVRLVVDEMEHEGRRLREAGLPAIFNFVDDNFGPLSRLEELACELEARRVKVAFACEMRLAALIGQRGLAERLAYLRAAGLTRLFVGVESLNEQTLRSWRKPYDVSRLPEVIAACKRADISLQTGYILWHADQTVDGALDEVRELWRLGIYSHRAALSRMIVVSGSELAARRTGEWGLERLGPFEEEFVASFAQKTSELTERWTRAAIAEPYEAARAMLTGDSSRLDVLRRELAQINAQSFALLTRDTGTGALSP